MIQKVFQGIGILGICFMFCGCTANGNNFKPLTLENNSSVIYVYRNNPSYEGSGVTLKIDVDGERIGGLKCGGYLYKVVSPGEHKVSCKTESESSVLVDLKAGEPVYIEAEVVMGFFGGRPKLEAVPEITGKSGISGTKYSGKS
jgi:hypothetical protein